MDAARSSATSGKATKVASLKTMNFKIFIASSEKETEVIQMFAS
jgi:hypothetical protein